MSRIREDPEEYEDDESEDGPVDYPMDGGDDGDDDDGDSSGDDARDEDEDEEDEEDEEEEEHLAPADSTVIPADEPRLRGLLAMITHITSTPISLSPPSAGERLARCMAPPAHSPPLPPSSGCLTQNQALRIASTQALIDAVTAALPPPSLPPSLTPYHSPVDHGQGIDFGLSSRLDAEERRQGIRDVGYGIRDTWVDPAEAIPKIAPMTVGEVYIGCGLAELHEETVWMVEEEAYASREAWAHSIGLSQATHQELQTHRDHVYAHETYLQATYMLQLQSTLIQTQHQVHETRFHMQQTEIAALRETDRRRQDQMVETLEVIRDMRREMSDMQAVLLATARAAEDS
ncbi:hypothetical protein Tco_0419216 [Tanacetum coccineum]